MNVTHFFQRYSSCLLAEMRCSKVKIRAPIPISQIVVVVVVCVCVTSQSKCVTLTYAFIAPHPPHPPPLPSAPHLRESIHSFAWSSRRCGWWWEKRKRTFLNCLGSFRIHSLYSPPSLSLLHFEMKLFQKLDSRSLFFVLLLKINWQLGSPCSDVR